MTEVTIIKGRMTLAELKTQLHEITVWEPGKMSQMSDKRLIAKVYIEVSYE